MHPYAKRHSNPAVFLIYMLRSGSEFLGGTVVVRNTKDAVKRFEELGRDTEDGRFYVHLTLSLPKGMIANRSVWLQISATTLEQFRLDPEATPWVAVRHADSACDHIHIGICLVDFADRLQTVVTTRLKCERVNTYICAMLDLPTPAYFDDVALPRLKRVTPARRMNSAQKKLCAETSSTCFVTCNPKHWRSSIKPWPCVPVDFEPKIR